MSEFFHCLQERKMDQETRLFIVIDSRNAAYNFKAGWKCKLRNV